MKMKINFFVTVIYIVINSAVECSTYLTTLSDFSSFVLAEGSDRLPVYRRVCNPGGGDLLSRQPVPGPPNHLGRRLDRMEDLENHLLSLLADVRGVKPGVSRRYA